MLVGVCPKNGSTVGPGTSEESIVLRCHLTRRHGIWIVETNPVITGASLALNNMEAAVHFRYCMMLDHSVTIHCGHRTEADPDGCPRPSGRWDTPPRPIDGGTLLVGRPSD